MVWIELKKSYSHSEHRAQITFRQGHFLAIAMLN
jgi:hypothetical protein